jgi:hypothetical protein
MKCDVDKYYSLLVSILDWQSKRMYNKMLECCAQSLPLLVSLVRDCKHEYGKFDLSSIPAIEVGCRYWAAINDTKHLQSMSEIVQQVPELLDGWGEFIESAFKDAALSLRIQGYVAQNPGVLQNQMRKLLSVSGKDTGRIIGTLVNLRRIVKTKSGKTYELRSSAQ